VWNSHYRRLSAPTRPKKPGSLLARSYPKGCTGVLTYSPLSSPIPESYPLTGSRYTGRIISQQVAIRCGRKPTSTSSTLPTIGGFWVCSGGGPEVIAGCFAQESSSIVKYGKDSQRGMDEVSCPHGGTCKLEYSSPPLLSGLGLGPFRQEVKLDCASLT